MPQISVVVPVYNVEDYLPQCLDSILAQDFHDFELILVDDGSADKSGEICDGYAGRDSRVHVIHQKNQGLSAARNAGIDYACGTYVTFIDSDDAIVQNYFQTLFSAACEADADMAVCGLREFSPGEDLTALCLPADPKLETEVCSGRAACLELYLGNRDITVNAVGKLFRAGMLSSLRFPVGRLHEDQAVIPIAYYNAANVAITKMDMYLYRKREESITHKKFAAKRYDDIWAIDTCITYFAQRNDEKLVDAAYRRRKIIQSVYAIYAHRDKIACPKEYRISLIRALAFLRRNVSDTKYEYYLGQLNPKLAVVHQYIRKMKQLFGIRIRS